MMTSNADEVQLFDLASKPPIQSWSPNPWKTRLILNLKKIPYRTTWLEYADIAPTLQGLGLTPNTDSPHYTVPAIRLPASHGGKLIMGSDNIAHALEKLYPNPPLHVDDPTVEHVLPPIAPLRAEIMPKLWRNLLNPSSEEFFGKSRTERFGMPLDQFEREQGGDKAWEAATPAIKELGAKLRENKDGPFFKGTSVSYADLRIVAALEFFKRIDEGLYQRAVSIEPALAELFEASKPWLQRSSY